MMLKVSPKSNINADFLNDDSCRNSGNAGNKFKISDLKSYSEIIVLNFGLGRTGVNIETSKVFA